MADDAGAVDPAGPPARRGGRRAGSGRAVAALALAIAAVVTSGVVAGTAVAGRRRAERRERSAVAALRRELRAQRDAANGLSTRVAAIEGRLDSQPDPGVVARTAARSVYTVEIGDVIGSAFVIRSSSTSSDLVTNYHVVADALAEGKHDVSLKQGTTSLPGTIGTVNRANDLATITVAQSLPPIPRATNPPEVGDPVIVVGAPLGLGGTVSNGIISALRDGFIQFSAPISPGNSGGPVVDRTGRVVGVARSKLVGEGASDLSFAIPIELVCATVHVC